MISYVFIESRDPFESRDTQFVADTATALKEHDNEVTVFLIQNGVLAARRNSIGSHLPQLASAGVTLLVDGFSLKERGIAPTEINSTIRESNVETLVDILVRENTKAIWH